MKLAVRSQFVLRSLLYFSLGARAAALPRFAPRRAVPAARRLASPNRSVAQEPAT
ncbi:hypothetical protein [Burkholderia glumae]